MSVELDPITRRRRSIGAVMLWVVGIALALGIYRTAGASISPIGLVVLVIASFCTYRSIRKMDRRLIESRSGVPTAWNRAIEVSLLIARGLYTFLLAFIIFFMFICAGLLTLGWLRGDVL